MLQTILGANGSIGKALVPALRKRTDDIRLVSRQPEHVVGEEELMSLDLTNSDAIPKAIKSSDIVYVTIGFPYSGKIWEKYWPPFMRAVISACLEQKSKLVFFDNIYMYDCRNLSHITEDTPHKPCSKKGKVRKQMVEMIWEAVEQNGLKALIARCADFYGPDNLQNSILNETIIKNLAAGKSALWLGNPSCKHSFTYVPDAAEATALLGNSDEAYGQAWHLPTADNPPTGREWAEMVAGELGVNARIKPLPLWALKFAGIFNSGLRELPEMSYQYTQDYIFDSSKFQNAFGVKPTSYADGIKETISRDYP